MRFIETNNPDDFISNLKYTEDDGNLRLTFRWPTAAAQVYVFKNPGDLDLSSVKQSDARLYTLQEYKKLGGFMERKISGTHTYYIFPFIRENGEDILLKQSDGQNTITCMTGQITVQFSIKEKSSLFGNGKLHIITLSCEQPVEADVLCYVVKQNSYPSDARDGTVYFFGEPLQPGRPVNAQVKTGKNEFVRLFINNPAMENLYKLQMY